MQEKEIKIRKIIATIDNKCEYAMDINAETTFSELKSIIISAAHLLKNSFKIFSEEKELGNEYNSKTMKEIFADKNPITIRVACSKNVKEEELIEVNLNVNSQCLFHCDKFKTFYCASCKQSICIDCYKNEHSKHIVESKADYLVSAKSLMERIFAKPSSFIADLKESKYHECINLIANLNMNIFRNLQKLLKELENKIVVSLEFFYKSEDVSQKNNIANIKLMQKHFTQYFIELKNSLNTKGIFSDEMAFLTIKNKVQEIEKFRDQAFKENQEKYTNLNSLFSQIFETSAKIVNNLENELKNYLSNKIFDDFKSSIKENTIRAIKKEEIDDLMCKNCNAPKKSINKISLIPNSSNIKEIKSSCIFKSSVLSPIKEEISQFEINNSSRLKRKPFLENEDSAKQINSEQSKNSPKFKINANISNNKENIVNNTIIQTDNSNSIKTNNSLGAYSYNPFADINNNHIKIEVQSNKLNKSYNYYSNMTKDIFGRIDYEITDFVDIAKTLDEQSRKPSIFANQNLYQEQFRNSAQNENNPQNENYYSDNNENKKGKEISEKEKDAKSIEKNSMGGDQINSKRKENIIANNNNYNNNSKDIEIGQFTFKKERKINQNPNSNEKVISKSFEDKNKINILNNQEFINDYDAIVEKENDSNPFFLFMCPLFDSRNVCGFVDIENSCEVDVNFSEAFGENSQINKFPIGGAYCNYGQYFYFSGGHKDNPNIRKIFFKIYIMRMKARIKVLPNMLYEHCNHAMIKGNGCIFVIGGNKSNKCEIFNINSNKWDSMAELNEKERERTMLYILNGYLYAFMGYNEKGVLDSVERINLSNLANNKWEIVKINYPFSVNMNFYGAGIYEYKKKIIFVGGKYGKGDDISDYKKEIYVFNPDENHFYDFKHSIEKPLYFIENNLYAIMPEVIANFIFNTKEPTIYSVNISDLK